MSLIIHRVAQYARFSSDNQRTESIDAQLRANPHSDIEVFSPLNIDRITQRYAVFFP